MPSLSPSLCVYVPLSFSVSLCATLCASLSYACTGWSRYRLSLRHDNADRRLTLHSDARRLGLITTPERAQIAEARWTTIERGIAGLQDTQLTPQRWGELGVLIAHDGKPRSAAEILAQSHMGLAGLQAR